MGRGLSVSTFAAGSLLVHVGLWAALSTVRALATEVALPTTVEFTMAPPPAAPEPEPEPDIVPPAPEPVVHHAPRPKPVAPTVAAPSPEPTPDPASEPVPSEGSALPEAVAGGTLAVGRPAGTLAGTAPIPVAPPPPAPPADTRGPAPDLRAMARGYLRDLTQVLHGERNYPRAALEQRLQGTVLLSITIDPAGQIVDVAIKRSSGHALLDRAAIASVRRRRNLPPAPDALAWRTRAVTLPVAYVLN